MSRRVIAGSCLLVLWLQAAASADARRIVTRTVVYAVQTGTDCQNPVTSVSLLPSRKSECGTVARVMVNDQGVKPPSDANSRFAGQPAVRGVLEGKASITGHVGVELLGPTGDSSPGLIKADLEVRVNSVLVGVVSLEGTSTTEPVFADFSLRLPSRLAGVRVRAVSLDVSFHTCVGAPACTVVLSGVHATRLSLPVRS